MQTPSFGNNIGVTDDDIRTRGLVFENRRGNDLGPNTDGARPFKTLVQIHSSPAAPPIPPVHVEDGAVRVDVAACLDNLALVGTRIAVNGLERNLEN